MKAGFYGAYATRSLVRGGQRTLLAIFCIAVGVLAVVALQLVGNMVNSGLTGDTRALNGGDVSVSSFNSPLPASTLTTFDQLTAQGVLTSYTPVAQLGAQTTDSGGTIHTPEIWAVEPALFPLSGAPAFISPSNGRLSSLLTSTDVVVTQTVLTDLHARLGDTVALHTNGRSFNVTITGVIKNTALFSGEVVLIAFTSFATLPSTDPTPLGYRIIYTDVPGHSDANAANAKQRLQRVLPLATITTSQDALQTNKATVQQVRYFLQVVGLLALLIGGIGIINTMQVLLRRRQTEIAVLKTTGFHSRDLYLLFGLEAGLLGLIGGSVGAVAGIGVSFLVKGLVENALILTLPTAVDPFTVLSGVIVGFCTALIFGLLPIVQASQLRPVAILRELTERAKRSIALSILLGLLLVALFFVLALSILQNTLVSLGAVGGGGLFLLLSLGFTLVAFLIGKLPVPNRFSWRHALLVGIALAAAIALLIFIPAFGILFLIVALAGALVIFLPRAWKATIKLALRNIERKKTRTSTTLVALFVGVFAIGLILTLSQSIHTTITGFLASSTNFNAFIQASSSDKAAVDRAVSQLSGVNQQAVYATAFCQPVTINGTPLQQVLHGQTLPQQTSAALEGVTGYDLTAGQLPTEALLKGDHDSQTGQKLTPADAGTMRILAPQALSQAPLNLKLGDHITLIGPDGNTTLTVTIIGFYKTSDIAFTPPLLGDLSLATTLTSGHPNYLYALALHPGQVDQDLHQIQQAVPSVTVVNLADQVGFFLTLLNNLIVLLTAVASLALLAGLIIIANAVGLAMLERRRELGIMKAIGYTSTTVLGEVLLENGLVGFVGALSAMALATLAAFAVEKLAFNVNVPANPVIVVGIVAATSALCLLIAGVVAWGATRLRPLDVLRYE
jgi:predicted lysophospholipase L1 biosynthesis ABC-type transport system permease subunit